MLKFHQKVYLRYIHIPGNYKKVRMSMPQLMIGLDFHHPVNYACKGIENILRQPLAS